MSEENVQIAVLKTEVEHLKNTVDEIRVDLREIKQTLAEARGGWKTLMLVAGVSSALGGLLAKFMPWFVIAPR